MTARSARIGLLLLMFVVASCSDGGGSSVDSTVGPTTTTMTATSISETTTGLPAETSTTQPAERTVPAGVNWTPSTLSPPDEATPLPTFEQVTATAGVPAAPPGFPFRDSDYINQAFTFSAVQFATGTCGCWEGGNSSGVFGNLRTPIYLFRSVDAGATWAQVDLASVLGDVNGKVDSIVEHDGAFILTATTSNAAATAPTVIDVLRSVDGAAWEQLSKISGDGGIGAVRSLGLHTLGSSLVLYGADLACDFAGSSAVQSIGPTYQTRIWTSTDGAVSWTPQSPADSGLDAARPPLPDATACAGLGIQDIIDKYSSAPRLINFTSDRVMVWSSDGARIVSSADGLTWSSATLEGTTALPSANVPAPTANSKASTIAMIDGEYVATNLEDYRNIDDTATGSSVGFSVVTWTSTDGAAWLRQPLGRPILAPDDYSAAYQFFVADGRLALRAYNRTDGTPIETFESVAGRLDDWTTCVAVSGANCSFSTDVGEFSPGADLSGINLTRASLKGRDLTDVSLKDATLTSTTMTDATIQRTNFDGATLKYIDLFGDLSTSTFVGATLTSVVFDPEFLNTELAGATITSPQISVGDAGLPADVIVAGRDLTRYSFSNGTLAGTDFSGANLTSAAFSYTDLTGAVFTGAVLDNIFFFNVTCPDGQPSADDANGPARCRL